jgi:uncharacterized cupin superfamily protein
MTSTDRLSGVHSGLGVKAPVRAATTANITLSGEQTIDGIAVVEDDRVLVKDQTTGSENGIYVASTGTWARAADFDGAHDVVEGTAIVVATGTANGNKIYHISTDNPIVIGTTTLVFAALEALTTPADNTVATAKLQDDAVTYAKMQNISATSRVLGRKTSGAGNTEECTLSEVLDFVGSAANGDILFRTGGAWSRLAIGTADQILTVTSSLPAWAAPNSSMPRSYLAGLTLSNNVGDATNDIDIAAGAARDSTNAADIVLAASLTKRLDANWAVGTSQGGLDTGAIADTLYYVWLIKRSDTGVVDVLFSTSATSPTMPTNYDYKRRIGAFYRVSAAIRPFTQRGDWFYYTTAVEDLDSAVITTARTLVTITAPPSTVARFRSRASHGTTAIVTFQPTAETDGTAQAAAPPGSSLHATTSASGHFEIAIDASSQIAVESSASNTSVAVHTFAYMDRRGRDD